MISTVTTAITDLYHLFGAGGLLQLRGRWGQFRGETGIRTAGPDVGYCLKQTAVWQDFGSETGSSGFPGSGGGPILLLAKHFWSHDLICPQSSPPFRATWSQWPAVALRAANPDLLACSPVRCQKALTMPGQPGKGEPSPTRGLWEHRRGRQGSRPTAPLMAWAGLTWGSWPLPRGRTRYPLSLPPLLLSKGTPFW